MRALKCHARTGRTGVCRPPSGLEGGDDDALGVGGEPGEVIDVGGGDDRALTTVRTCAPAGLFRRSAAVSIFPADDRRRSCTPAEECLRVRWMHPIAGGPMPSGDEIRD